MIEYKYDRMYKEAVKINHDTGQVIKVADRENHNGFHSYIRRGNIAEFPHECSSSVFFKPCSREKYLSIMKAASHRIIQQIGWEASEKAKEACND